MATRNSRDPLVACAHKLSTACAIPARALCCACADKRPHSHSYSIYVEGVGIIQHGARWESYCWACKEFWNRRVAVQRPRVMPPHPPIPEFLDQTEYLERPSHRHYNQRHVRDNQGREDIGPVSRNPWENMRYIQARGTSDEPQPTITRQGPSPLQYLPDIAQTESSHSGPNFRANERNLGPDGFDWSRRLMQTSEPFQPASRGVAQAEWNPRRIFAAQRQVRHMLEQLGQFVLGLEEHGTIIAESESDRLISQCTHLRETLSDVRGRLYESLYEIEPSSQDFNMNTRPSALDEPLGGHRLAILQDRLDDARANLERARVRRERTADQLEASEGEVQASRERTRGLQRMLDREVRSLIYEAEQAGGNHESPAAGTFIHALARHRVIFPEDQRSGDSLRNDYRARNRSRFSHLSGTLHVDGTPGNEIPSQQEYDSLFNEILLTDLGNIHLHPLVVRAPSAPTGLSMTIQAEEGQDVTQATSDGSFVPNNPFPEPDREQLRRGDEPITDEERRRDAVRDATRAALDRATTEESVDYPPFTGQIEAIESNNRQLRYERLLASYEETYASITQTRNTPRGSSGGIESTDEEEDPHTAKDEARGVVDEHDSRPKPKEKEEMTVVMGCKICLEQVADTACLPCGHLAMCQWCADRYIPSQAENKTRPLGPAICPICRGKVKQKVRIFSC